jgi:hypothetical protein
MKAKSLEKTNVNIFEDIKICKPVQRVTIWRQSKNARYGKRGKLLEIMVPDARFELATY